MDKEIYSRLLTMPLAKLSGVSELQSSATVNGNTIGMPYPISLWQIGIFLYCFIRSQQSSNQNSRIKGISFKPIFKIIECA
jgi:hypothetical protein